jgi:cytochrome c-type biogenesis protein CcmH/NrfG
MRLFPHTEVYFGATEVIHNLNVGVEAYGFAVLRTAGDLEFRMPESCCMSTESKVQTERNLGWKGWQAYTMAAICLVAGLFVGYFARGSAPAAKAVTPAPVPTAVAEVPAQQMPSLEDMKRMADNQVKPLLAKLQSDPKNADLLNQVGNVYRLTHQFKTAAEYYERSLDADPKNVGARTDLASCLYYQGDVDGAIAQLEKSLSYDSGHAGTLYNLGMIRWKGKNDAAGAVASWQKLLKLNPNYDNKDAVEKLISQAKAGGLKSVSEKP